MAVSWLHIDADTSLAGILEFVLNTSMRCNSVLRQHTKRGCVIPHAAVLETLILDALAGERK